MDGLPVLSRRGALALGAGWMLAARGLARTPPGVTAIPVCTLGKTGRSVPRLGLGCYPLGSLGDDEDAIAVLRRAFDAGVRYLDTAPSYGGGRSERRIGVALESWLKDNPGVTREAFFIATKTLRRDASGVRKELDQSLKNLRTGYVDSVQCHEVHDDWESLFGPGAAVAALEKARNERLVRFLGITGHRNPVFVVNALRRNPPGADGSGFVTALVPVNPIDTQHQSFVRDLLPVAAELGVAVIAMKVFGGGFLLGLKDAQGSPLCSAPDLLRYSLGQRAVAVAVPGCDRPEHVDQAVKGAAAAVPDADWSAALEARMPRHNGKSTEWYKDPG